MMFENFQFDSLADFMVMGGHGPYVWSAYGISALVLLYLALRPLRHGRKFLTAPGKREAPGRQSDPGTPPDHEASP